MSSLVEVYAFLKDTALHHSGVYDSNGNISMGRFEQKLAFGVTVHPSVLRRTTL